MPARTTPLKRSKPAKATPAIASAPIKDPRKRLARVIELLEANLGLPQWEGPRDALEVMVLTILSQNTADTNALRGYTSLCERYPRAGTANALKDRDVIPRRPDGSVDPVAIRLSQVSEAFFSPDWQRVLDAPVRELMDVIRVAGLPNTKAPAIQRVLEWLKERTGGFRLEDALKGLSAIEAASLLSSIKGVGIKTASVTLIEAWGADLCPVDTHVHRIIHRLGIVEPTSDPARTYERLANVLPAGKGFSLHHNLLTFGRTVCNAKAPQCGQCFLAKLCPWEGKAEAISSKPAARPARPRR